MSNCSSADDKIHVPASCCDAKSTGQDLAESFGVLCAETPSKEERKFVQVGEPLSVLRAEPLRAFLCKRRKTTSAQEQRPLTLKEALKRLLLDLLKGGSNGGRLWMGCSAGIQANQTAPAAAAAAAIALTCPKEARPAKAVDNKEAQPESPKSRTQKNAGSEK